MSGNVKRKRSAYMTRGLNWKLYSILTIVMPIDRHLRSSMCERSKCETGEKRCSTYPKCHEQRRHAEGETVIFPRRMRTERLDMRPQSYVITRGAIRMKAKQMINNESFHASSRSCHQKIDLDTLQILVCLTCSFNSKGLIGPRNMSVSYPSIYCNL